MFGSDFNNDVSLEYAADQAARSLAIRPEGECLYLETTDAIHCFKRTRG